jgi:hypothetical protein
VLGKEELWTHFAYIIILSETDRFLCAGITVSSAYDVFVK